MMKKFNFRGFFSIVLFLSFVAVAASGVALFVAPHGRDAYWINWKLMGINKTGWESLHLGSALVFVISGVMHLAAYNWKIFARYFRRPGFARTRLPAEPMAAITAIAAVFVISAAALPPVSILSDAGEKIKKTWIPEELKPPFPHAELMSIGELCAKEKLDVDEAIKRLREAGIKIKGPRQMIAMAARNNNISARKIYLIMKADTTSKTGSGE